MALLLGARRRDSSHLWQGAIATARDGYPGEVRTYADDATRANGYANNSI